MTEPVKHNLVVLVFCSYCNVKVRRDRLEKHILKVHKIKERNITTRRNKFNSKPIKIVNSINFRFYDDFRFYSKLVCDWLDNYLPNCYSSREQEILILMFLINNEQYNFSDINKYIEELNEEEYLQVSKKFRILYNDINSDFMENEEEVTEESYSEHNIDWYELNGYENRFGKKYLGYLRREYENSRFGSYPLHDDYGEESDPEGFTNIDY